MMKALKCKKIEDVLPVYRDYDVIAIDEGQFFSDVKNNISIVLINTRLLRKLSFWLTKEKLSLLLLWMPLSKENLLMS